MNGFAGEVLRVNVTKGTVKEEALTPETVRRYEGGRCFGAKVLLEELKPGIDPLGPENKLVFATGPVTGTVFPGQTRYMVIAKSPLTGCYGEAQGGGSFGGQLKRAGYDAIIVEGKAQKPAYLWIDNGKVEIRDASHLWGKTVGETDDLLREAVGKRNARVACIGPSGEKLVRFACVISEKFKAAGRCGLGAVMGSKNLKAVVVHGTRTVPVADSDGLREHVRNLVDEGRKNPGLQQTAKYGTSGGIPTLQKMGILPTKNFQMGEFAGVDHITGQRLAETILSNVLHCDGCNVPHYREVTVKDSPYGCVEPQYSGAEYETVASLGSLCLIDDLVAINRANQLCNMYGVDTISAGVVMAWVMECFEKELLSLKDLDGLTMQWGNAAAMVKLLEKTCRREGIGDVLAEGVKRAAEKIGKGSEAFAIHVRGQEIAMHESRGKKGLALLYTAAGPRGGVHTEGAHDPVFEAPNLMPELDVVKPVSRFAMEGKGDLIHKGAALRTLINDLGICLIIYEPVFGRGTLTKLADIVNSITGWGIDVPGLMELGERANVMARCFNVREGVRRKDDYLPARFAEALPSGSSAGQRITRKDMDYMLDDYYAAAGWSNEGVPSRETLERLGISWVAKKIGV